MGVGSASGDLLDRLGLERPLVQAGMAGGAVRGRDAHG
jgi:hypothetical protein